MPVRSPTPRLGLLDLAAPTLPDSMRDDWARSVLLAAGADNDSDRISWTSSVKAAVANIEQWRGS